MSLLGILQTRHDTDRAAKACVEDSALLDEVLEGLGSKDARLAGDCAEVMTKVAQREPALVAPHAAALISMLDHKNGRVRWESAHAVALVSALAPKAIEKALPKLLAVVREDPGVIVRDYCLDTLAGYGSTGAKAALKVFPALCEALDAFGSRHAARVLDGLLGIAKANPKLAEDVAEHALRFSDYPKAGIKKAARALMRELESERR